MAKRSNSEEDEVSVHESAVETSAPPTKKTKKSTEEKKTEKKTERPRKASKASSASDPGSKKGNVAKNVFTNAEGEKYVDLGKRRRATVRSFKGTVYVDIREFFGVEDDLKPGKKGISLTAEQWSELRSNGDIIDNLMQKL